MISRIKKILLSVLAAATIVAPFAAPIAVNAAADIGGGLCQGVDLQISEGCDPSAQGAEGTEKINGLITTVIDIFSLVVGIVAVIMIIVGGLKYITSGGDSGNVTGAKNTILYAVIGLVVVALAQFIVKFVLGKATA